MLPSAVSVSAETLREVVDRQADAVVVLECVREPSQGNDVVDFIFALTNPAADATLCTGVRQGKQVCKLHEDVMLVPPAVWGKHHRKMLFLLHFSSRVLFPCRCFAVFFCSQCSLAAIRLCSPPSPASSREWSVSVSSHALRTQPPSSSGHGSPPL